MIDPTITKYMGHMKFRVFKDMVIFLSFVSWIYLVDTLLILKIHQDFSTAIYSFIKLHLILGKG